MKNSFDVTVTRTVQIGRSKEIKVIMYTGGVRNYLCALTMVLDYFDYRFENVKKCFVSDNNILIEIEVKKDDIYVARTTRYSYEVLQKMGE
jgi:hypothetical protein